MKKVLLTVIGMLGTIGVASASNNFSYTATGSPGNSPDGTDQNNNPVSVWTEVYTDGGTNGANDNGADGQGVYFGNPEGSSGIGGSSVNSWQEYSYQNDGTGLGGSVNSYDTFAGGALTIGQTVSINFIMRADDPASGGRPPGSVGVSLMNGSSTAINFGIYGGEANASYPFTGTGYFYTDAGTSYGSAGGMGYQYQSTFNISFTVTGANTYSAIAGSDSWSGTFNGSLTGIDVYNDAGGNGSDVGFNNLTVVTAPEPGTLALAGLGGGVLLAGYRKRNKARV